MKHPQPIASPVIIEGIDFNKLGLIIRNNWFWIVLIFTVSNLATYLVIRYTKELYESSSEIKLDLKEDAVDFGIKTFSENNNLNIISGEIELLKSKLFLSKVLDSIPLDVSYYSKGEILNFELYGQSPIVVQYQFEHSGYFNTPIFFDPQNENGFEIQIGESGKRISGTFDKPLQLEGGTILITRDIKSSFEDDIRYFFVINSRDILLDYLTRNLTVEPQNFNANTIRIT
ncbi:MAG: Wzz/FepE/Etk N-terminal domain-containing protein, partial [Flammeovirgaceae bacterium]|nr:Wzz/FepE/Etk N-terminal domain-containing protein [Flammeovirgaceae bacterium]